MPVVVLISVCAYLPRFLPLDEMGIRFRIGPEHITGIIGAALPMCLFSAALQSVLREAILGALLTGLMVLLFLRDWRSSAIVVVTIPFALLAAVMFATRRMEQRSDGDVAGVATEVAS